MAQFLNKGEHIFIPFDKSGKNLVGSYGSPYIYKSEKTARQYGGRDAHELVEYAPIVRCGKCWHFVPNEANELEFWGGTCLYNECYVDTGDFCSRGELKIMDKQIDICSTCVFGVKNYIDIPWYCEKHWHCKPGTLKSDYLPKKNKEE